MRIRPATADDVRAIVELLAADQLGAQREDAADPLPPEYGAAFDAIDRDPNNLLVVVETDARVVATLQLTFIPYLTHRGSWRAQIEGVRVAADQRGRGVGRELMVWAIAQARVRGCHLVQLTSNKIRADAHHFYTSLGFQPTHEGFKLHLDAE
ncbi:MAG: GNAT family N-acetyltransferase [Actinobacteria bacterium]|nr:GNAT family N-acetyltransferase [Actinomycetota bacterium]